MEQKTKKYIKFIVVIAASLILNCGGRQLTSEYPLPGWFDTFGTFLTAYAYGPVAGALLALVSSGLFTLLYSADFIFSIVGVFIGISVGLMARKGWFETVFHTTSAAGVIAIGAVIMSTIMNFAMFDGNIGNVWGDGVKAFLEENNTPELVAAIIGELYMEFPDKLITSLALFVTIKIVRSLRSGKDSNAVKTSALLFAAALAANIIAPPLMADAGAADEENAKHSHLSYIQHIYNAENGLDCGHANAIAQTSDGILWIGTYSGLYRYNGREFTHIDIYDDIRNVNCLYVDQKDQLWVGTNDNGVVVIDRNRSSSSINTSGGLPSDSIRAIVRSSDDIYYIGTSDGLVTINSSKDLTIRDEIPELGYVSKLSADENGNVAAVNTEGRMAILRGGKIVAELNNGKKYSCCFFTQTGTVLFGSSDGYINEFSFDGSKLKNIRNVRCGDLTKLNNIYTDESGIIWVCTDSGIGYIDEDNVFTMQKTKNFDHSVENMIADYQGNLWFASSRLGLLRLTRSSVTDVFANTGLSESVVNTTAIYKGLLYVGADDGLIIIDTKRNESIENELTSLLAGSRIRCMITDSSNTLWICTYGEGLVSLSSSGDVTFYKNTVKDMGDRVRVCSELSDGSLAVSSSKGLFFIKDGEATGSIPFNDDFGYAQALCFLQDDDGTLYAGTDGNGIAVIRNGKYEKTITRDDGLASGVILRMVKDPEDGSIYIVTSNSICRMTDGEINVLKAFPYSNNYDVILDDDGEIFVTGSAGIYIMDKKELLSGEVSDYMLLNSNTGLVCSLTVNAWNAMDENKSVYLAADRGVFKVNLDQYFFRQDIFLPMIKEIRVDDESHSAETTPDLTVDRKAVKVEFIPEIINYTYEDPIIGYYLEGFNQTWTKVRQSELNSAITYTNLKPGEYTFHLAVFSDNGEKIKETSYTFEKETAIYDNFWFRYYMIGVAAVFVGWLTWFVSRTQIQRTLELQQTKLSMALQQVQMGNETILAIAKTVDAKDVRTSKHSQRVSEYSALIAKEYGFTEAEQENIRKAALLHDIGKIGIPDSVLNKPGRLTDEEYAIMKTHVTRGAAILKDFTIIEHVAEGARYHHERYDGKGYPDHLAGEDIPLYGRIISIADAFDAMTANRVYRKRQDFEYVMNELHKGRGTQFDPHLLDIFLKLIDSKQIDIDALYADAQAQPKEEEPVPEKKAADAPEPAKLSFSSFDGGGPDFIVSVKDHELFTFEVKKEYSDPDHDKIDGAAFTVNIFFRGLKPGETSMTIEERSDCAGNRDHLYNVKVDEKLAVHIENKEIREL